MEGAGSTRARTAHLAFSIALTATVAAVFWAPAFRATDGEWPVPLDDVFIHFGFARSLALGHPFEWIPGQGYSSGETAPLWALVLAPGWLVGFRGPWLGIWAGLASCVCLVFTMRLVRVLAGAEWIAWIGSALLVSVGILDWLWVSGMETALFGVVLAAMIVRATRACDAGPVHRPREQWLAGLLGALLVWCRPEAVVIVAPLAVVAARAARSQSAIAALARVGLPGAIATLAVLGLNRALTGDAASAGALLKLLSSNPYFTDVDRARELVLNLLHFRWKVVETHLAAIPTLSWLLPLLACASLIDRRTRALGAALLAAALAWVLLVSWNGAARFQNFRYYMPAIVLLLIACTLGLRAMARRRYGAEVGAALAAFGIASAAVRIPAQVRYFRDCAENIHHQQVTIARHLPRFSPRRVLLGDAGAIPYVSNVPAIDALGLGGYRRLPWARAATQGEASTIELVQSLAPEERPSHLVMYPNWFLGITSHFGREIDRVTLAHNVICGGPSKAIYEADWRALDVVEAPDDVTDELDTADVTSERDHAYASPAPWGGWTRIAVLVGESGQPMFDGGRTLVAGRPEAFTARAAGNALVIRTEGARVEADVDVADRHAELTYSAPPSGRFGRARASIEVRAGDRVTITPRAGPFYDFHVWVTL
jgi:hypothetical protein